MFDFNRIQSYYIACGYTDMRKQIDGLVAMVELQYGQTLDESSIFLFCGHRADRIKVLYGDHYRKGYWSGNRSWENKTYTAAGFGCSLD